MEKVLRFLRENSVCCLATCSNDKPRASAMEYVIIGDNVLFATDGNSIKAGNLKANNKISFSVNAMPKFVTIDGITAAPSADEISAYNKNLFERHPEFKEMVDKGMMKPFVIINLYLKVIYYNDYSAGMSPTEIIKL